MQKIFCFLDFINEFRKIRVDGSNTGRTKILHNILDEPKDPRSYSSSVLLRDFLRKQEISDVTSSDEVFNKLSRKERFRIMGLKKADRIKLSLSNLKFLMNKEKEGPLYCEYCNKGPLVVYGFNPYNKKGSKSAFNKENGATCDHKIPRSKGGDPFDYDNLAVCCHGCNQKKSNMSWENWESYMKSHL